MIADTQSNGSRREGVEEDVRAVVAALDGSTITAVALLSGLSPERITELGGVE